MPCDPGLPGDVLRHAADALVAIDAQRRILSMNPRAEALTGIREAEAVGLPCREVLRATLCENGCPFDRAFHSGEQVTSFDARIVDRAGQALPVCINTSVLHNGAGEKIGLVESIRDIRHVLRLIAEREEAIAESQRLAAWEQAVIESIGDGVISVDLECRITSFNHAAELLTGCSRNEALGKTCSEVFGTDFCPLRETLRESKGLPMSEVSLRLKDGSALAVWLTTEVLLNKDGALIGAVEVLRDRREVNRLQEELRDRHGLDRLVGHSPRMQAVYDRLERVAATDSTVLILGESGTGKELVAEILHARSRRWNKPLVKVNCAALPESLLESELFGHVRGSFTGAVADRAGRFELANGGDLFLDEVGDLPLSVQVKLLRVLQEREFERVGGTRTIQVDVRILAATHRELAEAVTAGRFREDLFYRLNVVPLELPPLRDHLEDVPLLSEHILNKLAARGVPKTPKRIAPQAMKLLMDHHWPGNVRELENALEYALVTTEDGWIRPKDLPARVAEAGHQLGRRLASVISGTERGTLLKALQGTTSLEKAAHSLGISRATLWRKMRRHGLRHS